MPGRDNRDGPSGVTLHVRQTGGSGLGGLLLGGMLVILTACASPQETDSGLPVGSEASRTVTPARPAAPSTTTPPSTLPSAPAPSALEDPAALVQGADELFGTYVRRTGSSYSVRSLWAAGCDHFECAPAILVISDPPAAPRYRVGSYNRLQRGIWAPRPPGAPAIGSCAAGVGDVATCVANDGALTRTYDAGRTWQPVAYPFTDDLLAGPIVSLAARVDAVVGGGDGATLFPFEQVARWRSGDDVRTYRVDHPDGVMGYSSGSVVLSDGRLLTLLADWSDGTLKRPNGRHHGLWGSHGEDWAAYAPTEPVFSPPLVAPPRGKSPLTSLAASADPDPVVWVQTWDLKVYVSTDGAATFTELVTR